MITLTLEKKYQYALPKTERKNSIQEYIGKIEQPVRKVVESFWTVLTSPVEKS